MIAAFGTLAWLVAAFVVALIVGHVVEQRDRHTPLTDEQRAEMELCDPAAYRACPDCDLAAGIAVPEPKRLDTSPVAKRGRTIIDLHPGVRVPAEPVEPQLAHAGIPSSHRITRGAYLTSIPQPEQWVLA